jgi:hypothetical protein
MAALSWSKPGRPRSDLRRAQLWAVETLKRPWSSFKALRLPGVILAWDMGAGKTGAVLTAMRDLLDLCVIRKVLIVAPLLVAQTTWPDEIEEWEHTRCLTWTLLRVEDDDAEIAGVYAEALSRFQAEADALRQQAQEDFGLTKAHARRDAKKAMGQSPSERAGEIASAAKVEKLERLCAEDTQIHIINKEAVTWLWEHFGDAWPYDVIVIDEASMLKSGKHRAKGKEDDGRKKAGPLSRFGALAQARKHVDAVIEMTGTPAPNGVENLWGLAYIVDLGKRLGSKKTAFLARWFVTSKYSFKPKPHAHSVGEIMSKLRDIMFSLDPADYAEMPPMMPPNIIKVKMPPKAMDEYKRFRRHMVSDEYDVEAVNAGVLHNKLLQFANGSMYQEDGEDVFVHDAKLEALERIVEETEGEPLLVAYSFQFDLARIQRKFPNAVVLNETNPRETKRLWNEGKIPMLLAHPMSAGHGLNFQFGGNQMVWYGLTADLELYQQFRKRLHRPGQTKPVFNHMIIAEGTIDEKILPVFLDPKAELQDEVLRAVRVYMEDADREDFVQRRAS